MTKILIADSGSTKADWLLADRETGQTLARVSTQGITPVHQTLAEMEHIVRQELLPQLGDAGRELTAVHFYGAGCLPSLIPTMRQWLSAVWPEATLEVAGDLLGAARALCRQAPGIACILGTGANSCLYDGRDIVQNTPALGYILGDEGSGAVLGRDFLNAIFKHPQLASLRDAFLQEMHLTMADVIDRVYRHPMANRFLASCSPFIHQHIDAEPLLQQIVTDNFRRFFRHNLEPYHRCDLPVGVVGSMAYHYRPQLAEAARQEGYRLGTVLKAPAEALLQYHC